ncbi:MAG: AMP-binding protein [Proteobacteria bacterium]|nr:AMP-binding protein [Pseudomonadota bacterium]
MLYPSEFAKSTPAGVAYEMCHTGEAVTFAELEARSNRGAHLLRKCGLAVGDHIVILMENNRHFLEVCYSADRSGLYYTTASTYYTDHEIEYIVEDCGAKVFVTSHAMAGTAAKLVDRMPGVAHKFMVDGVIPGFESWEEACAAMPTDPIPDEMQGLDMLYSSGTTGRPKGVKWSLTGKKPGDKTFLMDLLSRLFGYDGNTRYLSPGPLYHAAPLRHSMTTINMGGTAVIMKSFDAEGVLRTIEQERITHSQFVPTMFIRMLKLPEEVRRRYDLWSLRVALHAAAPCPVAVKERMLEWWGMIIYEYYAGTENNGFCFIGPEEWLTHKGSVGRAALGVLHICDDDGNELGPGEKGKVYFSDGKEFSYHNDPEKTARAYNEKGWSTIGDIGKVDEEGYLYLLEREAFVIISGGVNIYPQEAENILASHPKVMDVAVFGIPNEDFGEEVKAVIQPTDMRDAGAELEQELIGYCRSMISPIKCPRSIDFQESLPRHPTGKLYKRLIRDKYWENENS